jgi:hypothetical protein
MANQRPTSLYAQIQARKLADRLDADTKPTRREEALDVLLIGIALQGNNGELRFPKLLIDQADEARVRGRRLQLRFDDITFEYVVTLTQPEQLGQQVPT